jgi:F1F0 ATPase subunit 2
MSKGMEMNETLARTLAWMAGCVLGALFFGGLWWTVHKGVSSSRPALWFLASLVVRMSTVLAGVYFVSGGHLDRLLLCLFGIATARPVVTRLARTSREGRPAVAQDVRHAP